MNALLKQAAAAIRNADSLLITAGAGMGIDSGLPDFRGENGFWRAYPPLAKLKKSFVQMANPTLFAENPRLAWGFYGLRLNQYRQTVPHQGFAILQKWAKTKSFGSFVFTSNVDGQFQKAGFDERRVMECHGTIHRLQCTKCLKDPWLNDFEPKVDAENCWLTGDFPKCPQCGNLARPNILMFSDYGWREDDFELKNTAFEDLWLPKTQKLVVIELGAGVAIPTVRYFSEHIAARKQATLIRINPDEALTARDDYFAFPLGALSALTQLDQFLTEQE